VARKEATPDRGFFPLTVQYQEKALQLDEFQVDFSNEKANQ
jgi:hypothetical protein